MADAESAALDAAFSAFFRQRYRQAVRGAYLLTSPPLPQRTSPRSRLPGGVHAWRSRVSTSRIRSRCVGSCEQDVRLVYRELAEARFDEFLAVYGAAAADPPPTYPPG